MNCVYSRQTYRRIAGLLLAFGLLAGAVTTEAQNDKKKKKKNEPAASDAPGTVIPLNDEQQIDYMISEVLGAWQIGDTERMHKDYAEDVTVVRGDWQPPVLGWSN